jgi:uncharacterized membrane protein SpoIIM required for sporulation
LGFLAFALGFAAGVPTAVLLFTNGLVLGAFLALFAGRGLLLPFLGWILPHGVPEIAAILLCGAAGLSLGRALLFPGRLTRRDALGRAGRQACLVAAGCLLLFFGAGLLEGWFRQLVTADEIRLLVAGVNALGLALWLGWPAPREAEA